MRDIHVNGVERGVYKTANVAVCNGCLLWQQPGVSALVQIKYAVLLIVRLNVLPVPELFPQYVQCKVLVPQEFLGPVVRPLFVYVASSKLAGNRGCKEDGILDSD